MAIADTLIILATFSGPIAAVQAQKWLERSTERRNAKKRIFYALMATRATRLAPEHVQALNMIDLEFTGTRWHPQTAREKAVVNKWRIYADHLSTSLGDTPADQSAWIQRGDDLFTDLLEAFCSALGYSFTRVELRRGIYRPRGHTENELRQDNMQRSLARILAGADAFPMRVVEFPFSQEAFDLQQKVNAALLAALQDGVVRIQTDDEHTPHRRAS